MHGLAWLALFLGGSGLPLCAQEAAGARTAISYPELLRQCVEPDWLWRTPVVDEACWQWTRPLPEMHAAGNLLVDAQGPGMLTRLWAAAPRGTLTFEVDGAVVWVVDLAELCAGDLPSVPAPWASQAAGAGSVYLPIPFRGRLRLFGSDPELVYQATVRQLPAGTLLPSFSASLLTEHGAVVAAVAERLQGMAAGPSPASDAWFTSKQFDEPCVVRSLRLRIGKPLDAAQRAALARQVVLRVEADGEELVRVAVADFFAAALEWRPWQSLLLGIDDDGVGYCRWPMPLPRGGRIELLAGDVPGQEVSLSCDTVPMPADASQAMLFRAHCRHREALGNVLAGAGSGERLDWLDLHGNGRLVGSTLLVRNPSRYSWAEGGMQWRHGVATGGLARPDAWLDCDAEFGRAHRSVLPLRHPLQVVQHGQGPGHYGVQVLHRSRLLDAEPFVEQVQLDWQPQHAQPGVSFAATGVFYWYGAPGAHVGRQDASPGVLLPLPPAPPELDADRHEGEQLRVLANSGGIVEVQDLGYRPQMFSGDKQLWWRNGKPGDVLELAVPVREDGEYRVTLALCMADDYGQVAFALAGEPLGEQFDGYSPRLAASGPRDCGVVRLQTGQATLRCELRGKHEKAKPAYMVGIDYLRLERVR